MKRLVNNPTYDIQATSNEKYKATIMMPMDCECQPFSVATRLTSVYDLQCAYSTNSDNISYNIAKNLLSTDKVNIVGLNHASNENLRSTIAVYDYDDTITTIYPSYSVISAVDLVDDGLKRYTIKLTKGNVYKNVYFKIYDTINSSTLFAIINTNTLSNDQQDLYNNSLYTDLIYNKFGITRDRYTKYIVLFINNLTKYDNILFDIKGKLIGNSIDFSSNYGNISFDIQFSASYINEPILTNVDYEYNYSKKELIRTYDDTLGNYKEQWYAYRIKVDDIKENFYFLTYPWSTKVTCHAFIHASDIANDDDNMYKQTLYNAFKLNQSREGTSTFSYVNITILPDDVTSTEWNNIVIDAMKKYDVLYDLDEYVDSETNKSTKYLTIYSHKIHNAAISNMHVDTDYYKSYNIDYFSNYGRMLLSGYSKLSTSIDNISFTISRYNDRYSIQVWNKYGTDIVDTESYSDTDIESLIYYINENSKYLHLDIYQDYLPTGTFTLETFNIDTNYYKFKYLENIAQMDKDFILENDIDIIYNTKNDIDYLNAFNKLVNTCDNRVLLLTDNIESIRDVERYDFSAVSDISDELTKNIDTNSSTLKDTMTYKRCHFSYKGVDFYYNTSAVGNGNEFIRFVADDRNKPYIKFSAILERFVKLYNDMMKNALVTCICNNVMNEIIIGGNLAGKRFGNYISYDEEKTLENAEIYLKNENNSIIKISSYDDFVSFLATYDMNPNGFAYEIPKWIMNDPIIPIVTVKQYCATELNNTYNNIAIQRRSLDPYGYDTTYHLLYNIFNNGLYEFDILDKIDINYLDNEVEYENELKSIYNSDILNNSLFLNNLFDNEYYRSVLNPNVTYHKYRTTLEECLPAILQINHAIAYISNNSSYIDGQATCNKYLNTVIEDVSNIINIANEIKLTTFEKKNRNLKIGFRIRFSYSTNQSYDFNITITK